MKNTLSVFDLKQQKNVQIKIKNQSKTNSKSKFQIWFSNSFKIISGTFWFRALPRREKRHIYGDFCIAHFTLLTNTCSFLPTNVRFFHALKFRTLTCESAYLFIVLHKHSIWHFLTSLPKFSTSYKFFHTRMVTNVCLLSANSW